LRVVLPNDGNAERRHDRVADVLLDRPAPRFDEGRHGGEEGGQERPEPLGIQALPERRRPGHVGEQDGDELAFLLANAGRARSEVRSAAGAEAGRTGDRSSARWTGADERGTARRTEGGRLQDRRATGPTVRHGQLW